MRNLACVLMAAAAASACISDPKPPGSVSVYKSLGSLQCGAGGASVDTLEAQLRAAGVAVRATACGTDGRMRPAVCGAPDGRIGIFDVPASQRRQALAQGYSLLASLPDAQRVACR